jgi:ribosomal protein L7Ae-like RNA K-turn-binding protein
MGLCKSRQQKPSYEIPKKMEPTFRAPPGLGQPIRSNLRPDAEPFHPQDAGFYDEVEDEGGEKEAWEAFLDRKMRTQPKGFPSRPLVPRTDGSFTSGYRDMLSESKEMKRPPWRKHEGASRDLPPRDFDILKSWRNAAPKVAPYKIIDETAQKKRKTTALKKQIIAQREAAAPNPLWTRFAEQLQQFKDEQPSQEEPKKQTQDDLLNESGDIVPYGLADRFYMSDTEDKAKAHRHIETSHAPIREYVDMFLTPELETAVTECLFRLRHLKMQELALGQQSRRYAVGFREVGRLLQHKMISALLIAPDVEKTSGGALEEKVIGMKNMCEHANVPVIFALSRRQLGAAIRKNVTISVLAIQDTRGAEGAFAKMIAEAEQARALGAQ